jgi:allantoinase
VSEHARVDLTLAARVPDGPSWQSVLEGMRSAGLGAVEVVPEGAKSDRASLREVLAAAAALDLPVVARPRPDDLVRELEARADRESEAAISAWAATRPPALEATAVSRLVEACRATGARVHVHPLSCAEALDAVSAGRFEGLSLTAGTCPHYLEFTIDDLEARGTALMSDPILRTAADRERLWQALGSGEIDAVASDHDPARWPGERSTGSPWVDRPGLPGVELLLPYLYSEGHVHGRLTLERLVQVVATGPALALGLSRRKGRIAPGLDADFVVLDEDVEWEVQAAGLHGLQRTTPLEGRTLKGRVRATYVRGRCVFNRDPDGSETFGAAGTGRVIASPQS